jgi:hypothetical protein
VTENTELSLSIILPFTERVPLVIARVADPERFIFPTTVQVPCILVTPDEAVIPDDGQAARTGSGMKLATNIRIGENIVLFIEVLDFISSPYVNQYLE